MRVGKTLTAIRAADRRCAEHILWLTTGSARFDHARAWRRFQVFPRDIQVVTHGSDEPIGDVVITTYDLAAGALRGRLAAERWDAVVLDESHKLKNRKAARTKAVYGAKCTGDGLVRSDLAWALSGTPMPNDPSELWTTARALFPEVLEADTAAGWPKVTSYTAFTTRYCRMKQDYLGHFKIVGGKRLPELKARFAPRMLRRTLDQVAPNVPPLIVDGLPLEGRLTFPADAAEELKAIERAFDEHGVDGLVAVAGSAPTVRRLTGLAIVQPLVRWLLDRHDSGGEKVVVYAYHVEVLRALEAELAAMNPLLLDGSVPAGRRQALQDRFRDDASVRCFLGQIQAAGEAIDLSVADEFVFAETSWVPGENDQAAFRIVNVGKSRPTLARVAYIAGSIHERIQEACVRKMADIRDFLS